MKKSQKTRNTFSIHDTNTYKTATELNPLKGLEPFKGFDSRIFSRLFAACWSL